MKFKGKRRQISVLDYQKPFIEDFNKYSAMVGGFGSGKTMALNIKLLRLLIKRRSEKIKPKIGYYAPSVPDLWKNNIRPFEELLKDYKIRYFINKNDKIMQIPAFGAQVMFNSMHLPETIKGYSISDALIDEFDVMPHEKQEIAWVKILARVRQIKNGTISIGTTPEGFRKTHDLFAVRKIGNMYQIPTYWNPYLPGDYIDSLKEQYDEQLLEQYLQGKFINLAGLRAYYGFNQDSNLIDINKDQLSAANQILIGMDFNVDPMSAVVATYANNFLVIFDEIMLHNSNTEQMGRTIKGLYPNRDVTIYPDMTGGNRKTSASAGVTDLSILKAFGFKIKGSFNKQHRDSLNAVNNAFAKRLVFITRNCKNLINDYEKVITDKYNNIDKSDAKLTHVSDASRYLIDREFPINHIRKVKR